MKRIIFFILSVLLSIYVSAQFVTEKQALDYAEQFFAVNKQSKANETIESIEQLSITRHSFVYLVHSQYRTLILTCDMRLPAVIGITDERMTDLTDLPPAFKDFISYYENATTYVRDSLSADADNSQRSSDWVHIYNPIVLKSPLLVKNEEVIQWGQSRNNETSGTDCSRIYNLYCPENASGPCEHTVAGCIAVAMAQVMWYWEWPNAAVSTQFPYLSIYDWDSMPQKLYNSTPQYSVDQVARLLVDCGKAAYMNYGAYESGTQFTKCKDALKNDFAYSPTMQIISHNVNTYATQLSNELFANRPIIAVEVDGESGHAFIIDGYGSDNNSPCFHINWGWKGMSDGWYRDVGTVSTSNKQYLIGIQPAYPACNGLTYNNASWSTNFKVYNGGIITLKNQYVAPNKKGYIISETEVKLLPGCYISEGSQVHIAIRDMNCFGNNKSSDDFENEGAIIDTSYYAAPRKSLSGSIELKPEINISPNPTKDLLTISANVPITEVLIYNLDGQCVLQTTAIEINVSNLPSGIYILHANTEGGGVLQGKFIHL